MTTAARTSLRTQVESVVFCFRSSAADVSLMDINENSEVTEQPDDVIHATEDATTEEADQVRTRMHGRTRLPKF